MSRAAACLVLLAADDDDDGTAYTIEAVLVLDHAAFETRFNSSVSASSDFLSAVANQVDFYYRSSGLGLRLQLRAVVIWSDGDEIAGGTDSSALLTALEEYADSSPAGLPSGRDAVALVAAGPFDDATAGKGVINARGPCPDNASDEASRMTSVSLLQWFAGDPLSTLGHTAATVAHELGHNLGANHSDEEGCDGSFIMRSTGGNLYRWSECTLDALRAVLPGSRCLEVQSGAAPAACGFGEYELTGGACAACAEACADCAGSPSWCTHCPDGTSLFNGACVTDYCVLGYRPSGAGPFGSRCEAANNATAAGVATLGLCDESLLGTDRPACPAGQAVTCDASGALPQCVPVEGYVATCGGPITAPQELRECGGDPRYALVCSSADGSDPRCERLERIVVRPVLIAGESVMWALVTVFGGLWMWSLSARANRAANGAAAANAGAAGKDLELASGGAAGAAAAAGATSSSVTLEPAAAGQDGNSELPPPPPPGPPARAATEGVPRRGSPAPGKARAGSEAAKSRPRSSTPFNSIETPLGSRGNARPKKKKGRARVVTKARTPAEVAAARAALPPGWSLHKDAKSRAWYYHNDETGQTQWEAPGM